MTIDAHSKNRLILLVPAAFILLVSLATTLPLLTRLENPGVDDWDQHTFYSAVPRDTILRYHQLPFWNPYYCGGNVLLANAQARFCSPTFLLVLLFGPLPGIKLEILVHLMLGMLGMYLFARKIGLGKLASIMPALVFMAGGVFPSHLSVGHTWIMAHAYLPFIMLFYEMARENSRYTVAGSIAMALMILSGGTYAYPHAILLLGSYALVTAIRCRSVRPLLPALLMPALSLLLSAFRFLPLLDFFGQVPRLVESTDSVKLSSLFHVFLDRSCTPWGSYVPEQFHGWHEYNAYIGFIPAVLGLVGLVILARRDWRTIPLGILFFLLALGDFADWSPWHLLHQVPPFSSLRAPSRFLFPFLFFFGLWAASALGALEKRARLSAHTRRGFRGLSFGIILVILLISATDLVLVNGRHFKHAFPFEPWSVQRQEEFVQQRGNPGTMFSSFMANQGTIKCYEPAKLPKRAQSVDSPHYRGEVYIVRGSGEARYLSWSPNRLSIAFRTAEPDLLVINQNYEDGWQAEGGAEVTNWNGLVALPVTPDQEQVILFYRPRWFLPGLALSLLGVLLAVLLVVRGGRNRTTGLEAPAYLDA